MADPTPKKKLEPAVTEPAAEILPQNLAADTEQKVLAEVKAANFRHAKTGAPTAVLPGGRRIDATPFVKSRYTANQRSAFLGNPESIVKEDFKRAHPGWKFAWPLAKALATSAYVNSQRYKKVPYEAIDKTNHMAMVQASPEGDTIWMQHVLVAMAPEVYYEEYGAPVDEAIGRTAMNRQTVEAELNASFGQHGYKGEYSVSDIRQER